MIIRALAAALVAVTLALAVTVGSASANEQLQRQVGHQIARYGLPASAADGLDAAKLAGAKLVLNDSSTTNKRPALERLLAQ